MNGAPTERLGPISAQFNVRVLGGLAVRGSSAEWTPINGHAGRLLAEFVAHGPVLSRSSLAEALWPVALPASADSALRVHLSRLRRLLGGAGAHIERRPGAYTLIGVRTDVDLLRDLLARARRLAGDANPSPDVPAASKVVAEAQGLVHGEPLGARSDDVALAGFVQQTRGLCREVRNLAADLALARGLHREILVELERAAAEAPFDEECLARLALAYYRCGRQREALGVVREARRVLVTESGLDPGPALQVIESQILAHDPAIQWSAPPRLGDVSGLPRSGARQGELVGRGGAVREVVEAMAGHPVVVLTGPPGIGKSRVVRSVVAGSERLTCVLDAEQVAAPDLLAGALASALGLHPDPQSELELLDIIGTALSRSPSLLVVDGGEHLDPHLARFVADLIGRAPGLRVLVGHRSSPGLDGEVVLELPLLREADTITLMAQQLEDAGPIAELGDDLARIARATEGHPLTAELVAGWVQLLGPAAVARQLDAGTLPLSTDGQRSILDRVEVSLGLLTPEARSAFPALGAFHGDFDVAAASAVAQTPVRVSAEVLRELHRASLIQPGPALGRWRLLAGVRDAANHLASREGREIEIHRAWLSWLKSVVAPYGIESFGLDGRGCTTAIQPWLPDLLAAFERAVQEEDLDTAADLLTHLFWYWVASGDRLRGVLMGDRIRPLCEQHPNHALGNRVRSYLPLAGGTLAWAAGRLGDAEAALVWTGRCPDPLTTFLARLSSIIGLGWIGELDRAGELFDAALAEPLPPDEYPYLSVLLLVYRGALEMGRGSFTEARGSLEEALDLFGQRRLPWGEAHTFQFLAWLASFEGDWGRAESCSRLAAVKSAEAGDHHAALHARLSLADVLTAAGRHDEARAELETLTPELLRDGDYTCASQCLCALAETELARGHLEPAEWLAAESASIAAQVSDTGIQYRALIWLSAIAEVSGNLTDAARWVGCLDGLDLVGGRPIRADDAAKLEQLRQSLAADLSPARFDSLVAEGTSTGATRCLAETRANLALARVTSPLADATEHGRPDL
jgi:DNA-binding SARP family transcriptional activator/tetratricopeptide (TPR) repeat protein